MCRRAPPRVDFEGGVVARVEAADAHADAPSFDAVASSPVAGDGRAVTVAGQRFEAAPTERFVAVLEIGAPSPEAWIYRVGLAGEPMDLLRVSAAGGALRPEPVAATAPGATGCDVATLRATSPRSVTLVATCAGPGGPRIEGRWIARGATPRVRSRAALEGASAGVSLDLVADDADGDGVDELVVTTRVRSAALRLRWVDRGGALSRDVAEPAASLGAAVQALRVMRGGGDAALARVDDLEALRRLGCVEEGAPGLVIDGARGVACGVVGGALERGTARVHALLALGEVPAAERAARALASDGTSGAAWPDLERALRRTTQFDRGWRARLGPFVASQLDAAVPARTGVVAFDVPVAPTALVLRGATSARVGLAAFDVTPAEPVVPRALLASIAGSVVVGVAARCDGVAAVLCDVTRTCEPLDASATALPPGLALWASRARVAAAGEARCDAAPEAARVLAPPVGQVLCAVRDRLLVAVDGRPWFFGATASAPVRLSEAIAAGCAAGSAVSRNGRWIVLPGADGIWVRGVGGWRLRPVEGLEGRTAQLRDLTITDDGALVAGTLGTQLVVIERRPRR